MRDPYRPLTVTGRVLHKDGRSIWMQTTVKVVFEDKVPVATIGVSRDVTAAVEADLALQAARNEAEAANRAKGDFLANVSHEIRTPMNGILGALHLLDHESLSPQGRELMRQANDCGRMLTQLLNDVLDFSKIEAGQLELAPEPMDAAETLAGVIAMLEGQARAKGLDLRVAAVGGPAWIAADPVRLGQIRFNLIGNAVKFTERGHVAARLTALPLGEGRARLRLEVEDTGIGIPAVAQAHLFERFRQAESDTTRRFGGTGLGLSICRELANLMGGEINATSAEGAGSTFTVRLPLRKVSGPVARSRAPVTSEPEPSVDPQRPFKVLAAEDNTVNQLVLKTLLHQLGIDPIIVEDGVLAVDAWEREPWDVILMDVQMPRMDGPAATAAIRERERVTGRARTSIIALTANAMAHQVEQYKAAGMDGFIAKPIEVARLFEAVQSALAAATAPISAASVG